MFQFLTDLQHSHASLRAIGAAAAAAILVSCLAIAFLPKPSRKLILPAITLGLGVVILSWTILFFESF